MKIYFATHNKNKLREIQQMLPESIEILGLDDLDLHEDIPETADTIEGNSHMKTAYVYQKHGVACFGDDTGLEVEALSGAPGVYSARYAGPEGDSEQNMALLLKNLETKTNRKARFKTVITYINNLGEAKQFTGIIEGNINTEKSGTAGFGYDPIFIPAGYEVSFAEMSAQEKNSISHRGRAFQQLINYLKQQS